MTSMLNVGDRVVYMGFREAVVVDLRESGSYIIKFDDGSGWPDRRFGEGCWYASRESLVVIQRGFEYDMDA